MDDEIKVGPFAASVSGNTVTLKREIYREEDYRSWMERTYDEGESYHLFGLGASPERLKELITEETVILEFGDGKIKKVSIINEQDTYVGDYTNGFHAYLNGQDAGSSIPKELLRRREDDGIVYYGVKVNRMFNLPSKDDNKRMTTKDEVFGYWGLPLIIANKNEYEEYVNIRFYDPMAEAFFHLLMPFELHPDLPNDVHMHKIWLDAMKHLIVTPDNYPAGCNAYLRKFFGKVGVKGNAIYYAEKNIISMMIKHERLAETNYTFIYRGQVRAMTQESAFDRPVYFIRDGMGYDNRPYSKYYALGNRYMLFDVYIGNDQYATVELTGNGCNLTTNLKSAGYTCMMTNVFQPVWDAFGIMRQEDVMTFNAISREVD